ncbi:CaiB/BaiF CoA-transferase family protein [Methylopila sp. 73B]|uniref:CaiB/BaiF CoA transferase family protein n=1 Tax=Methylopila sp. 73B TaxID=1120792 RepID=UPI0003768A85|nr:CaiB/BaiF CoA-transferase family protein [Methylopila sp. 73B]
MSEAPTLLAGMKVLSFCHYLQGPAASQYLADMGADVVKVEPPSGAFERGWAGADTFVGDVSAFFLSGNRNKRSLAIDLKTPEGKALALDLIAQFDVVLENYRPGVMDRLGIGYGAAQAVNPRIVYASATGFGSDGPMRDRPGQDLLVQARVGLMAATGDASVAPTPVGCAAVDQHGASLLAMGVLGAYVRALKTGRGARVEASLFNAGIDLQAEALALYYSGGRDASVLRRDRRLATWFHQAPYGVYALAEGFVALSLSSLAAVARALDSEDLAALAALDPYVERDAVAVAVAGALEGRAYDEVSRAFDRENVWHQRVQDYDDLRRDPQAIFNGAFREIPVGDGVATVAGHPLRYDGAAPSRADYALEIGQHTEEVLAEAGLSPDAIRRLAEAGAVTIPNRKACAA